jgi:hypothetical protein
VHPVRDEADKFPRTYGEEPVRVNHNRQARRAALCIRARGTGDHKLRISPRGIVLTAYGHDLARLASSIADEIDLSVEEIRHLVPPVVFVRRRSGALTA